MAFRTLAAASLAIVMTLTYANPESEIYFNQYVEGALKVYAQFKEPSKTESEQFYSFIKSKWQFDNCTTSCKQSGKKAAIEYANRMSIPLEVNQQ